MAKNPFSATQEIAGAFKNFTGPSAEERKKAEDLQRKKQACEASGGTWDEATKTCLPLQESIKEEEKEDKTKLVSPPKGTIEATTSEDATMVTLPDGKTILANLSQDEINEIADQQAGKVLGGTSTGEGGARGNIQPIGTAKRQQLIEQERQRLIEQEIPKKIQLNPEDRTFIEKIPLIGSIFKGGQILGDKITEALGGEAVSQQELAKWALNDIQRKEIEKGLTWSESIGAVFEGTPGVPQQYLDIESPRGNLEEVHADLVSQYRRITGIESNVKMGYLPVKVAEEQIEDINQYILRQEARLKLLIQNSPSLNFNSDRVNGFETDILKVREKIFQAKLNILQGAEQDPTTLELFQKQQQQDEPDWATSPY